MKIAEDIIEKIEAEFKAWEETQYVGKNLNERQKLRAVLYSSGAHREDAGEIR